MAFESVITFTRGRAQPFPGMSVKFGRSGSTTCYLSTAIRAGHRFVEVEIDEVTRHVRVRPNAETGAKMSGAAGGSFAISKSFGRKVIPAGEEKTFIELHQKQDGWWYGSY